jgi:hypothetical protein
MRKLLSTVSAVLMATVISGSVAWSFGLPFFSALQSSNVLEGLNTLISRINANYGMVAALPGPIASTATTAEQTFATTSIPTGSFTGAGQTMIIRCAGITASDTNNKTAHLYFGGFEYSTATMSTINENWELELTVTQATATATANSVAYGRGTTGTTVVAPLATNDTTDNLAYGNTVKCTGTQGTASAADMTMDNFIVFQEK